MDPKEIGIPQEFHAGKEKALPRTELFSQKEISPKSSLPLYRTRLKPGRDRQGEWGDILARADQMVSWFASYFMIKVSSRSNLCSKGVYLTS